MLKKPESMDECVYFTNRDIGSGRAMAWVYRKQCPKCSEGVMGKPINKRGKPDKKAPVYECTKCHHCGFEGQTATEYERKSFQGVQSYVFECQKCKAKIPLTKKLKDTKKKGKEDIQ